MKTTFHVLTGRHKGKALTLPSDLVTIGRDPEAEIRVNSTEVSRMHCEIQVRENGVFVKDLGSRNGTFVNGEAIYGEVQLSPGDTLHVGTMVFELMGKKKPAPSKGKDRIKPQGTRAASKTASEDDVVDWLAEDEPVLDDEDTTIITNADAMEMGIGESIQSSDSGEIAPRSQQQVQIRPLESGSDAAEAAEIIKQFWASK